MSLVDRRYTFDVRPRHRETLASYTRRLLAVNFETEQHRQHLIGLVNPSQRLADREAAWLDILTQKTKRSTFHFEADPAGWLQHADGNSCETCTAGLPVRFMCTHCAHGAIVEQHPHFDDLVCIQHRRWVGLDTPAAQQYRVSGDVVRAAIQFRKLRRKHRIDLRFYTMLTAAVRDSLTVQAGRPEQAAASFLTVIRLATELTRVGFARTFLDPGRPFAAAYEHLTRTVGTIIGRDESEICHAIWLYARPTFWAIRDSLITGTSYAPAWAHDLPVADSVIAAFVDATPPDEPFTNYLAITGDDQLSAARHGLKDSSEGALRTRTGTKRARKILTICAAGHQFESTPPTLANLKNGKAPTCPLCRHRLIVPGYNDLATTHPTIAAEFDLNRNGDLTPMEIAVTSNVKYYWTCPKGHSYQATAANRAFAKTQCPLCLGRVVVAGVNDLSTTHPELVADWHPRWLSYMTPTNITAGSNAFVTWLCPNGHTYEMRVWDRAHGKGCLICARAATRASGSNLATTHPHLAAEWHPTFNRGAQPSGYTAGSKERVYWLCPAGHYYPQRIERRVAGYNCSVCSRRNLVPNVNDLATTHPVLVSEWHPYLNTKSPDKLFAGNDKHWWLCTRNHHKYQQSVPHRVESKGCPLCPPEDRILSSTASGDHPELSLIFSAAH